MYFLEDICLAHSLVKSTSTAVVKDFIVLLFDLKYEPSYLV